MRGWGVPEESAWPYSANHWPPAEPPDLDILAKKSRILAYQRVRNSMECKMAVAAHHPVCAAFEITYQWFSADKGKIEMPPPNAKIIGAHAVWIEGYDDNSGLFTFRNSWGVQWGDLGFGYLPYPFFDTYFSEAWIINAAYEGQRRASDEPRVMEIEWGIEDIPGGAARSRTL